ncbi:MAG TPA: zinc-binding dehydrogenase [Dehalococcoidia bacterium]|nr:zinc-binding dehydrogenase [Dehalococcoidia bacterium]
MRALVATPGADVPVAMGDVAEPEPHRAEALIAVQAISLNRGEVRGLSGSAAGARPGWDVAGVVARAAADGSGPAAGVRVVGLARGGGWAERVAVPTGQLAALPEAVGFAQAATLPVAGLTAFFALRLGGLLLGRRVLVTGAAGGVGRFAVQLAALAGARVTGVAANAGRAAGLRELGASEVMTSFEREGAEFDLLLESVGGASLAAACARAAQDGLIVSFGDSSREPLQITANEMRRRPGVRLYGFNLFHELQREPGAGSRALAYLAELIAAGKLDPQIALEADWREPGPALAALMDRQIAGKAVLHIA